MPSEEIGELRARFRAGMHSVAQLLGKYCTGGRVLNSINIDADLDVDSNREFSTFREAVDVIWN